MSTLGQLLLKRAWITEGQLKTAVERQQQLGGRLGTCLLELDLVTEQLLTQILSDQLGVPAASADDLYDIPPEVIAVLPSKVALRARAIPFRVTGSRIDVAMLDVGDLALQNEISFVAGKRVKFHIGTELRITEALSSYYEATLQPRFLNLALRLSSAPSPPPAGVQPSPRPSLAPPEPSPKQEAGMSATLPFPAPVPVAVPAPGARQAAAAMRSVPLTPEERAALDGVRVNGQDSVGSDEPEEVFIERLESAKTSRDVGNALLEVLSGQLLRVLLFRVSGSGHEVSGWLACGPEIDHEWFEDYSVGLKQTPVFERLASSRQAFRGRLERHPSHGALARCWGGSFDNECLMLPLYVRDHLTCFVYGDRASLGVTGIDVDLTKRLISKAAIAFERCILRHKLHSS